MTLQKPLVYQPLVTIRDVVGNDNARFSATHERLMSGWFAIITIARNCGIESPLRWLAIDRRMCHIIGGAASSISHAQSVQEHDLVALDNDCMRYDMRNSPGWQMPIWL